MLRSDHLAAERREGDRNILWRSSSTLGQPSRSVRASPSKNIKVETPLDDMEPIWLGMLYYVVVPEYEEYHVWRQSGTESSWGEVKEERLLPWLWWRLPLLTSGDSAVEQREQGEKPQLQHQHHPSVWCGMFLSDYSLPWTEVCLYLEPLRCWDRQVNQSVQLNY